MNVATLFINKDTSKNEYDCIRIKKSDDLLNCYYVSYNIKSDDTGSKNSSLVFTFESSDRLLTYIEHVMDLLIHDKDVNPHTSVDMGLHGFPIVALTPDETTKQLILKSFTIWIEA